VDAVGGLRAIAEAADAAVALAPQRDAGNDRGKRGEPAGAGQRLQRFLGELHLRAGAAKVHRRRFARDGDRLFERAHREVAVDRRGELGGQLEPFPLRRAEARQRERDGVGAGSQVDDAVPTLRIGHCRPDLFDERRAGRLDGHAGQDRARRIPHHAGNAALRPRRGGQEKER